MRCECKTVNKECPICGWSDDEIDDFLNDMNKPDWWDYVNR